MIELLYPDWPAPDNVRAVSTTRIGGVSLSPYDTLNLASHVGDEVDAVASNRKILHESIANMPAEPAWLNQVHGTRCVAAESITGETEADAVVTRKKGTVCAIMTADCLPVLLCDQAGTVVAAAHVGWRGLAAGVIEAAVAACRCDARLMLAWLGPAIGPEAFEVGQDVYESCTVADKRASSAFRPVGQKWNCDLYALARLRLQSMGINRVYGGKWSTFSDPRRFFSYRRDGPTGRMATMIWRI